MRIVPVDRAGRDRAGRCDAAAGQGGLDAIRASRGAFVLRTQRRRIAGVTADCIVSAPRTAGAAPASTLCLSREGAVLLGAGALGTAVRYTTTVRARDVALPATPGTSAALGALSSGRRT